MKKIFYKLVSYKVTRYILVGLSAVFIDFITFKILLNIFGKSSFISMFNILIRPEKLANTIAVLVGFLYTYFFNRYWSFNSKGSYLYQIMLSILLLVFNIYISSYAISYMGRRLGMPFSVAKLIMQAIICVWNYVISNRVIYKN